MLKACQNLTKNEDLGRTKKVPNVGTDFIFKRLDLISNSQLGLITVLCAAYCASIYRYYPQLTADRD